MLNPVIASLRYLKPCALSMKSVHTFVFAVLAIAAIVPVTANCRTSFKLEKDKGHYFIDATVNGNASTPVLIQTGFDGITMNLDTYNKILASSPLEEIKLDKEETFNYDNKEHRIVKLLKGNVSIDGLNYNGRVLVLDSDDEYMAVPVNMLRDDADPQACLICFDFKKKTLDFIRPEDASLEGMHTFRLVESEPMPVFVSTLELTDDQGHNLTTTGRFNFDLSNGTGLFLYRKPMLPTLKKNKFNILTSTDKSLNTVGQGIYARYCKIGKKINKGISVGITNRIAFDKNLGSVGPSFFKNGTVILDPTNKLIYYK